MGKKSNRGPNPTSLTVYMLCAHAAGRCQFAGCNKYLFRDMITLDDFNNSNIAHIVASSPDGPRGDLQRSHQLSDKLENLMLMCLDHHKMIDSDPTKYNEAVLLEMKQSHEKAIAEQCSLIYKQPTDIILFSSPIKGKIPVAISFNLAAEAVMPEKRLASMHGISISIDIAATYQSQEFWNEAEKKLEAYYSYNIRNAQEINPNLHVSVFPIAPIPLIMKFGYLIGDKIPCEIYQKSRIPDTWKWQTFESTNAFHIKKQVFREGNRVALVFSLTADIAQTRVTSVYEPDVIYTLTADRLGVDCIMSPSDLSEFWHTYQTLCDEVKKDFSSADEVGVFPAMPVSAAFEVGRRYMPGIYPKLKIFDDDNGFFETLSIGG